MSRASGLDPGGARDGGQEVPAVRGLAHGARRHRHDVLDPPGVGEPLEAGERLERGFHGRLAERAPLQPARAQADHVLLAADHVEGAVGPDADDNHVQGVRADVDRGDVHGGRTSIAGPRTPPCAAGRRAGLPPRYSLLRGSSHETDFTRARPPSTSWSLRLSSEWSGSSSVW